MRPREGLLRGAGLALVLTFLGGCGLGEWVFGARPEPSGSSAQPVGELLFSEEFETVPAFRYHHASWGSAASFRSVGGGVTNNALEVARGSAGSSTAVLAVALPPGREVEVSALVGMPASSGTYWFELSLRDGEASAESFDQSPSEWSLVTKLASSGPRRDTQGAFSREAARWKVGPSGKLSVGLKLGSLSGPAPSVLVDGLKVEGDIRDAGSPVPVDAGTPEDAGHPGSVDAGAPIDAGTTLPSDAGAADPGLRWLADGFDEFKYWPHQGSVPKGWTPWLLGSGDREWNIVRGESGWALELRKSLVQLGVFRQNRGFLPGDRYRLRARVRLATASGPLAVLGVHATGGNNPTEVAWGAPTRLSPGQWATIEHEFTAQALAQTLFVQVDLRGQRDASVIVDGFEVALLSPRAPAPWMLDGSPPVVPPFIFGLHDPGGEHLFTQKGKQGWVVHALAIGSDPSDNSGKRFSEWVDGHGVIARISHQHAPYTLPAPARFADFAKRCGNFVRASTGCGIWSIANEPTLENAGGTPITPELYRDAFIACRNEIKAARPGAKVITAGFVQGNLPFFQQTLQLLDGHVDGIAVHSYTNANYWNEAAFNDYRRMLAAVPPSMRHLPVYMTEAGNGATGPYPNQNNGFFQAMFQNVDAWNKTPGTQKVRSVNLYRWIDYAPHDQWGLENKQGMIDDLLLALDHDYRW